MLVFSSCWCSHHVVAVPPDKNIGTETVKRLDDTYVGVIIGVLVAVVLLGTIIFIFVFRRQRSKFNGSPHKLFGMNHMNFNLDDLTPAMANGKLSNGNMYNSIATMEDKESVKEKWNVEDEACRDHDMQQRTLPMPPAGDTRRLIFQIGYYSWKYRCCISPKLILPAAS